jgi:hypothetical protein
VSRPVAQFWLKVDVRSKGECWPYTGYIGNNRYGSVTIRGKNVKAHRFAFEAAVGDIPAGKIILHKCNNPVCCNPDHLAVGTRSENMRHASMSGAFRLGSSGIQGVSFSKSRKAWRARGSLNGDQYVLYQGPSKAKAIEARRHWENDNGITF